MSPSPPSTVSPPPEWRLAPWAERLLLTLFAVALVLPGLGTLAGADAERLRDHPASAATPVSPYAGGLAGLARAFDADFAFRARLVRWQATARYTVLGVSPLPTVARGRDGWWFYADDGAIEDVTSATPFTDADLEVWRATLQRNADWLAARGIGYVFVLAPDKHTVYPEFLPPSLSPVPGRVSRADQLVAMLSARTTVPVVDLRQPLVDAKARARVYHRTDTHWNDLGAVEAYRHVVAALHQQRPAVPPPLPADAFRLRVHEVPGLDLLAMAGLSGVTTETDLALVPLVSRRARVVEPAVVPAGLGVPRLVTAVDDQALPRALVYRDSFGSALVPFLAEHFTRAVFLWEYDVTPETVRAERPDVVIHEWAGRRLHTRLPYDAVAADPAAMADLATRRSPAARR